MRIGIVGNGVVGNATALAFADRHEVRCYDHISDRRTHDIHETLESDVIFVCLPTPQKIGSLECDISGIMNFFAGRVHTANRNYVLRSTVPIGTTRMLRERYDLVNLVHSPEFLTARTAVEDAANPTRLLIGNTVPPGELWSNGNRCAELLNILYHQDWPNVPKFLMSSDESEAVKLFQNSFSAVKIAYFNEIRCLTDKLELNWDTCMSALLAGKWINSMHTDVPGPDGKRGYGGTCLPKDIANLADCIWKNGCSNWMTTAAMDRNEEDRSK